MSVYICAKFHENPSVDMEDMKPERQMDGKIDRAIPYIPL